LKLPALRSDCTIEEDDGRLVVIDPKRKRRIGLSGLGSAIVRSLDRGVETTEELAVNVRRDHDATLLDLERQLAFLNEQGLFGYAEVDTTREQEKDRPRGGIPLVPPRRKISVSCAECGECCRHTDVAPFEADEIEEIRSMYPSRDDIEFELVGGDREVFVLLSSRRDEACPFLDGDGACVIHRDHGYDAKASCCRQFPVTLTCLDGVVYASHCMECFMYHEVRRRGPFIGDDMEELDRIASKGHTIFHVATPVMLDVHTILSREKYLALERELLETIDGWVGGVDELLVSLRDIVSSVPRETSPLPTLSSWDALGEEMSERVDESARFVHRLSSLYIEGGSLINRELEKSPESWRENDLKVLGFALDRLFGGAGPVPDDPEVNEIIKDFLYAKIHGKYLLKRPHILHSLAVLFLCVLLTSAAMEPGMPVTPEIWVDRCVRLTKIQRDTAWLRFLASRSNDLEYLLLGHVEAFT
jgi:Fe-S-cluster containining protein